MVSKSTGRELKPQKERLNEKSVSLKVHDRFHLKGSTDEGVPPMREYTKIFPLSLPTPQGFGWPG